ncbi:MAG: Peptidoglycan glycosyltransferase [Chloroflexi bacterium]|jgi:peptidoglycan glycosyltransferase|nr:Peptidoglycan glycosyltransferase [Chloroflexota bacterium]
MRPRIRRRRHRPAPLRPLGSRIVHVGLVLALAFGSLAVGAGYWTVARADELASSADDAAVIAASRNTTRGRIFDRDGKILASNRRTEDGEAYRVYADDSISHVVGYASRRYGTVGLERTYAAELLGVRPQDPLARLAAKFRPAEDVREDLRTSLSLPLQRLAVRLLGDDRGAVVMLDPKTGEMLVLASTPTYDASGIADPATAQRTFTALAKDRSDPLLPRATQGLYVPGSVFKIVTAVAGLGSGAATASTRYPEQPPAEEEGLYVSGYRVRDGHHPATGDRELDLGGAIEVSCNIWFALTGLATGGGELTAWADRLGFDAPLPFDLPTVASQLTNGGGPLPGGFADDVELANAAYGQGEVLATPLQMALVAAAVANDGVLMEPHLASAFVAKDGSVRSVAPRPWRTVLAPSLIEPIRAGMERAVEGSLGRQYTSGARVPGIRVAGKSGTAELGGNGEPHSWFIGFAPADDPEVVIAVLVEGGGSGAQRASPLAGDMLQAYFDGDR